MYQSSIQSYRKENTSELSISFLDFPLQLLPLCLAFMGLGLVFKVLVEFSFGRFRDTFLSWALIGLLSSVGVGLLLFTEMQFISRPFAQARLPSYLSSDLFFWFISIFLSVGYTFVFVLAKKLITSRLRND